MLVDVKEIRDEERRGVGFFAMQNKKRETGFLSYALRLPSLLKR